VGPANLLTLEGHGVWYWASPIEAKMCAGEEVVLVGGGNSAGQAAVFLSGHVSKVWMLVRAPTLRREHVEVLIDRIAATANIELLTRTEITDFSGSRQSGVESVAWHGRRWQERSSAGPPRFLFCGADPNTEWLKSCGVALDEKGFFTTGLARRCDANQRPWRVPRSRRTCGSVKRIVVPSEKAPQWLRRSTLP